MPAGRSQDEESLNSRMRTVGQLAVRVKPLYPEDSVGKAAEAVRASTLEAAPLIENGRLGGIVTAAALAEYLAEGAVEELQHAPVTRLRLDPVIALPESLSPTEALAFFHANDLEYAPVVDPSGGLLGMISNGELASAVCGRVRPPMIGGMATPFGVYLTGGGVRGGVGDWALVSTGAFMASMMMLAACLTNWGLSPAGLARVVPQLASWSIPDTWLVTLSMIPFALLFRLSWVTGYHAAEHQVVHTIEAGDELTPEIVREKPRVHPRCGTNLVAAMMIMGAFWSIHRQPIPAGWRGILEQVDALNPVLAMIVTFFLWRRIGSWLQQHVTTRPATLRQLESGITAAKQLMERYQHGTGKPMSFFQRLWNMGLLQVAAGWLLIFGPLLLWGWLLPDLVPPALKGLL